jgi:hypothetical protein
LFDYGPYPGSTAGNVLTLQPDGNVGVDTATPGYALDVYGDIGLEGTHLIYNSGDGVIDWGSGVLYFRTDATQGNINNYSNLMTVTTAGNVTLAGTLSQASDRNAKEDFEPVDGQDVLAKVAALPIQQWRYKTQTGVRHLGPMAQDFHAAFGLNGQDDTHIATVDEEGVALAAIQGVNQEKDAEIAILKDKAAKVESLKKQLNELEATVKSLAEKKRARGGPSGAPGNLTPALTQQ